MGPRFLDNRLPDRFWDKVIPEPNSGCWIWLGCNNGKGYGKFWIEGRKTYSHIISYVYLVDSYAEGLDLDHKCRNRICCNPDHLEPVTRKINILRGQSIAITIARNRAKTHCPKGHEYTPENTIIRVNRNNARECRFCARLRDRNRW